MNNKNQKEIEEVDENRLVQVRKDKLNALIEAGKNPYEITKNLKGKIMNFKDKDWLHEIYFVNGNKAISFTKDELMNDFDKVFKLFKQLQ